jgi:predicted RNA binding protein YcfA (HicA-like mRNA interferase family)
MKQWRSTQARRVLVAPERIGWAVKRQSGSHRVLARDGWLNFVFAFHDARRSVQGCLHASAKVRA